MTKYSLALPEDGIVFVNVDVIAVNPSLAARIESRLSEVLREHWAEVDGLAVLDETTATKGAEAR